LADDVRTCPACGRVTTDEATCAFCGNSLLVGVPVVETKTCPRCSEAISAKATQCSYCGADLRRPEVVRAAQASPPLPRAHKRRELRALVALAILSVVVPVGIAINYFSKVTAFDAYERNYREAREPLMKISAACEIGVNYLRYGDLLLDASFPVKKFREAYAGTNEAARASYKKLLVAFENYYAARKAWRDGEEWEKWTVQEFWEVADRNLKEANQALAAERPHIMTRKKEAEEEMMSAAEFVRLRQQLLPTASQPESEEEPKKDVDVLAEESRKRQEEESQAKAEEERRQALEQAAAKTELKAPSVSSPELEKAAADAWIAWQKARKTQPVPAVSEFFTAEEATKYIGKRVRNKAYGGVPVGTTGKVITFYPSPIDTRWQFLHVSWDTPVGGNASFGKRAFLEQIELVRDAP